MNLVVRLPSTSSRLMPLPSYLWPATAPRVRAAHSSKTIFVTAMCATSFVFRSHPINDRQGAIECDLIGTSRTKVEVQRVVPGRIPSPSVTGSGCSLPSGLRFWTMNPLEEESNRIEPRGGKPHDIEGETASCTL